MRGIITIVIAGLGIVACSAAPPIEPRQSTGAAAPATAQAERYVVNGDASDIELKIYRGGRLAALGHNHIISVADLSGEFYVSSDWQQTAGMVSFPVAALRIDEPARRDAAGPEFASEPSAKDIAGTQRNMLSERLLNGERFPTIGLAIARITRSDDAVVATLLVTIREQTSSIEVPVKVTIDANRLTASGTTTLSQRELGLTPFSVMLGALEVQDAIDVRFSVRAERP
ncbi:MAG: YceI family protein [Pseudomonadota bacterium]